MLTPIMSEDTKSCPACGETIKSAALKCRFCGEDIDAFTAKRDAAIEKAVFEGHPKALYSVGQYIWSIFTLGIALLVYWLRSTSVLYKLTTQRLRIETGFLSKRIENLELFRVDHVEVDKPIFMRMLGYGVLRLTTSDSKENAVVLMGLTNIDQLAEQIRDFSLKERERRGIRVMHGT